MMDVVRGGPLTIEVILGVDAEAMKTFELNLSQHGKTVLQKKSEDCLFSEDGKHAYFILAGEETTRLQSGEPVYAQAHAVCMDGDVLHSEVEEISVYDLVGTRKGTIWN